MALGLLISVHRCTFIMSYIVRNEQLRGDISRVSLSLLTVHRAGADEQRCSRTMLCRAVQDVNNVER